MQNVRSPQGDRGHYQHKDPGCHTLINNKIITHTQPRKKNLFKDFYCN